MSTRRTAATAAAVVGVFLAGTGVAYAAVHHGTHRGASTTTGHSCPHHSSTTTTTSS
jgi:hypothetical protein